jgi:hypothetical protein
MFSHISVTHARQSFSLWNKKFTLEADRNCFVFALAPTLFAKEQAERIITEAIRTTNNILLARSSHLSSLLEKINAGFLEATLQEELSQVQVFLALTSESSIDYSTR